ncbi:MAG: M56 family metallopeptidase, partial [Sedimentisphaerales bacterium]|nr:M56 family metallopeptidase [Sedimentisphaerales bacterium]
TGKLFIDSALPMLIQSGILIVLLLGLDFILRKRARAIFRYCIWMLVLVKLVLPTSLAAPSGIMYWLNLDLPEVTHEKSVIAGQPEILPPPIEPIDQALSEKAIAIAPSPVDIFPSDTSIDPEPVQSVTATPINSITSQAVIFLIWLSVVITMVLLLLQRLFFVRGLIAQSQDAGGKMADTLVQGCRQMGIGRKISLKFSSNAASPSVCGLFRPTILIPADLPNKLDSDHLKAVLLHELAHIKRGDLWVSFVQTILQIIYFYNSLLWLANAVIRQVREQAVDEMVQVAMGEKAENYPETLVNVFRLSFSRPALGLRLIGVVESKSSLRRRVKHMINRPIPKTAKIGIVGLLTILITAAVLLPMAKGEWKKDIRNPVSLDENDKPIITHILYLWGTVENPIYRLEGKTYHDVSKVVAHIGKLMKQDTFPMIRVHTTKQFQRRQKPIDELGNRCRDIGFINMELKYDMTFPPDTFTATLPNGVTVELVGVCEHPSKGK